MTIQVLDLAATNAFFVEMLVAVAALAHVLKNVAEIVCTAKFLYAMIVAEPGQLTIDTAFSAFFVTVEGFTKLLGGKLFIGVRGKEADECRSPRGVVGFLLHRRSFCEFENDSQIIAQIGGVVNAFLRKSSKLFASTV